jgi:hypothetical protein
MSEPRWMSEPFVIAERERLAANARHQLEWMASSTYYEPPWDPTPEEKADAERQAAEFRAAHPEMEAE